MTNANDRKQIQDYYKMLLFLNESTSDFFFLWDIREKKFHFARELNIARESTGDDVCTYTMDDLQAVAYPDDCKMLQMAMKRLWILISAIWTAMAKRIGSMPEVRC